MKTFLLSVFVLLTVTGCKEFMADCKEWEKKAEVEAARKSEFEGGSMAPCDKNMRMAYFVRKRIQELNAKWRQK